TSNPVHSKSRYLPDRTEREAHTRQDRLSGGVAQAIRSQAVLPNPPFGTGITTNQGCRYCLAVRPSIDRRQPNLSHTETLRQVVMLDSLRQTDRVFAVHSAITHQKMGINRYGPHLDESGMLSLLNLYCCQCDGHQERERQLHL